MPCQNLNKVHVNGFDISLSTTHIIWFRAADSVLCGMILENGSLTRCGFNWTFIFSNNGIGLHDVAAEESVHLTIAVQAFWSASLARL